MYTRFIHYIYECNAIFQQLLLIVKREVNSLAYVMAAKRKTVASASFFLDMP